MLAAVGFAGVEVFAAVLCQRSIARRTVDHVGKCPNRGEIFVGFFLRSFGEFPARCRGRSISTGQQNLRAIQAHRHFQKTLIAAVRAGVNNRLRPAEYAGRNKSVHHVVTVVGGLVGGIVRAVGVFALVAAAVVGFGKVFCCTGRGSGNGFLVCLAVISSSGRIAAAAQVINGGRAQLAGVFGRAVDFGCPVLQTRHDVLAGWTEIVQGDFGRVSRAVGDDGANQVFQIFLGNHGEAAKIGIDAAAACRKTRWIKGHDVETAYRRAQRQAAERATVVAVHAGRCGCGAVPHCIHAFADVRTGGRCRPQRCG